MFKKILNLIIPHFFDKEALLPITNPDLEQVIDQLKKQKSLESAIQKALETLAAKYKSKRFETYLFFYKWYEKDPNKLWQRTGFMHCTQQNYLLRILLVKSGWLKDEQIKLGFSLVAYVSPHQYLKVLLPDGPLALDPWNFGRGVPLGKYAIGFGSKPIT